MRFIIDAQPPPALARWLFWFEAVLPDIPAALERGETLVEVV